MDPKEMHQHCNMEDKDRDDDDSIPLADDDPSVVIEDEDDHSLEAEKKAARWQRGDCESLDSIPSMLSDHWLCGSSGPSSLVAGAASHISEQMNRLCLDPDFSPDEAEEKARLISQVLELQNTLDDLTSRVDAVKEENLKLRSENSILGQYIENLMQASSVFQPVSPKAGKKSHLKGVTNSAGHLGHVIRSTARAVRGTSSATPSPSSSISTPSMPTTSSSSPGCPISGNPSLASGATGPFLHQNSTRFN